ncbi:MAG: Fe-S cluster assembly protein SufB [Patescibacteria group bacterium]|jgi:Fe-S cluster assembly protein SufB
MAKTRSHKDLSLTNELDYQYISKPGISENLIREISAYKQEPSWMLAKRLQAFKIFKSKPTPTWGANLSGINYKKIRYFLRPIDKVAGSWSEVPKKIRETYQKIGIPQAERKFLAGVVAQYESMAVYQSLQKQLEKQGVIFLDMDTGFKKHPELVKKYLGTVVPTADNKFSALNTAVWSGGSLVYIPKGVKVDIPLQAYFRINAKQVGQFERTLIIAEAGSQAHYVEGCTAPVYAADSLHAGVVEIIIKPGARLRYTTVQNWSKNVYNLVTKRAFVYEDGIMEWVDGNLGSKTTMKYPSIYLLGTGAKGSVLSIALAGAGQHQDVGTKIIHGAPNTSSSVVSKSISKESGRTSYRGLIKIPKNVKNCTASVVCDALLLNKNSRTDTYPKMEVYEADSGVTHEATVGQIGADQLFYLKSRGISENEARNIIVQGFIEPIVKELPLEYAIELNRLIKLEMSGLVG